MKPVCLTVLALSLAAGGVYAQTNEVYRVSVPGPDGEVAEAVIPASDLFEPGLSDLESKTFRYRGKEIGLATATEPRTRNLYGLERDTRNSRAWGISVGLKDGPISFRVAHQNKNVAKVAPAMDMGQRTDAKNTILAANMTMGRVTAYTAYSASRGWGSSPLWNPHNPYSAGMASTPSTDSRDVLVGVAVPFGHTTLLASFVRKNDRDLANRDADQFAFGSSYSISRRTDFYAAYSHVRLRTGQGYLQGNQIAPVKGWSAINVGMRHAF